MRQSLLKRLGRRVIRPLAREASTYVADAVMVRHGHHSADDRRGTYVALAELESRYGWRESCLSAAELRVFSQNGEDGVLAEIFARIGTTNSYFIEFGIESGIEGNAVLLADVLGWSGLFIEGDPEFYRALSAKYANSERVRTLNAMVSADNVEALFREADVPAAPDLLSIDVDGEDYFIWKALTSFRPRVLVLEYNSALAAGAAVVVQPDPSGGRSWDGTSYFGCSLGALEGLASAKGYRLAHLEMTGTNAIFVRDEDWAALRANDVLRRSPNYYLGGRGHPPDPARRTFLRLD